MSDTVGAILAQGDNGEPIQVLGIYEDTVVSASTGAGPSAAVAIPANSKIVEVNCTEHAYFEFGGSAVSASTGSRVLPAGSYFYKLLKGQTHFSHQQVSTAGKISVGKAQ